jgi:UDP-2-acetamido-2,6-beta-L-arabino-hexul-4-ose reductase
VEPESAARKIIVTGGYGQFGWHLRCHLYPHKGLDVVPVGRDVLVNSQAMTEALAGADVVVHLAGVNRGTDHEVATGNRSAAEALVQALEAAKAKPHVIYASSTHALKDSVYGLAKREAGSVLRQWSERSGAKYTNFIFPHLFGENARPFYNSAVSTICHQIAIGKQPSVNPDGVVQLLHFGDASQLIIQAFENGIVGEQAPSGERMTIPELADFVTSADLRYRQDMVFPDLRYPLHVRLFNTYRSYLYPGAYPFDLTLHSDNRGTLVETVKADTGGQTFLSTTKPGITRGQHFHYFKVERFCVLSGKADIQIRRMFDDEVQTFSVSGDSPQVIDMPTLHTHNITNTGSDELVTMFWANEIFDSENPDTVYAEV